MADEGRIRFRCEKCSKSFRVPVESAGKRGKCPNCGALLRVPKASDHPRALGDVSLRVNFAAPQRREHSPAIEPAPRDENLPGKADARGVAPLRFAVGALGWLGPLFVKEEYTVQIDARQMTVAHRDRKTETLVVPRERAEEMVELWGGMFRISGDFHRRRFMSKQCDARRLVSNWIEGKDFRSVPSLSVRPALKDTPPALRPALIAVRVELGVSLAACVLIAGGAGLAQDTGGIVVGSVLAMAVIFVLRLALTGLSRNHGWICALFAVLYAMAMVGGAVVPVPGEGGAERAAMSCVKWFRLRLSGVLLLVHAYSGIQYATQRDSAEVSA